MPWLRGIWRLAHIALLIGRGNWRIRHQFDQWSPEQRAQAVEQWSRDMLRALGVELQSFGAVPTQGPVLIVCNHVTWLDILVLHACAHARFVAKSEVHHWPLIGPMAAAAGTLFIERASRRDAMRVVHQMVAALQAGDVLAVLSAGAYCMSMASNYNSRGRAAEVLVDGDQVHLIRERESVFDTFQLEHLPA